MNSNGWIKLHRSIKSHWINEVNRPRTYREAWEDILLSVNWEPKKVLVKGELIDCEPGQSLNSLQTWAKQFNWTIAKVRHFFKLLEKDEMVSLEGLQYTTRLTVCKWELYQAEATDEKHTEQQTQRTPKTSTKEDKEIKKKERVVFTPPTLSEIEAYFSHKIDEKQLPLKAAIESEKFLSHYSSNGWQVGRNKMKDWKAAINGWVAREKGKLNGTPQLNERQTKLKAI